MRALMSILVLCLLFSGVVQAQTVTELRTEYNVAQELATKYHERLQQSQTSQKDLQLDLEVVKHSVAEIEDQQSQLENELSRHQQVVVKQQTALNAVAEQLDEHAELYREQQEAVVAALAQANKIKAQAQLPGQGLDNHQQSFRMNAFMDYLVYSNGAAYVHATDDYKKLQAQHQLLQEEVEDLKNKTKRLQDDLTALSHERKQLLAETNRIDTELSLVKAQIAKDQRQLYEQTVITQAAKARVVERLGFIDFDWPLAEQGTLTSDYGYRLHPVFNEQRFHTGVDLAVRAGEPVKAVADGVVIVAGDVAGYGNTVIIDHGAELTTFYGHNSRLMVAAGDKVGAGELIALIGSTGISTGPHLHFEVRDNNIHVEPWIWLDSNFY